MAAATPLLRIQELCIELVPRHHRGPVVAAAAPGGPVPLLDHLSLQLDHGESLGLLGESGCGKTTTALALLRLLPPAARITAGRVFFAGQDLLELGEESLRGLRGNRIAMVFQEPLAALNPVIPVGDQVAEVLLAHRKASRKAARRATLELFERVGVVPAADRFSAYPHELSGGLRQRVLLAMAVACQPDLLIADEPTTALDLTLQAQVLELLSELQQQSGMALLLISHDLGVVAQTCQRVAVLHQGRLVEEGEVADVFAKPRHPYTAALLQAARAVHGLDGRAADRPEGEVPLTSSGDGQ